MQIRDVQVHVNGYVDLFPGSQVPGNWGLSVTRTCSQILAISMIFQHRVGLF